MTAAEPNRHDALTPAVLHILLALSDGAKHGYAIMQAVDATGGPAMGPGTVYGSLQRMQDAGQVRETDGPSSSRRRRYYELTAAGVDDLRAEARRLSQVAELLRARDLVDEVSS